MGVQREIAYAMGVAEVVYLQETGKGLVVTSACDGHSDKPQSLHNMGLAADFRTRQLKPLEVQRVLKKLREWLEPLGFDVVLEKDHFHVEYDPKGGESWFKEIV